MRFCIALVVLTAGLTSPLVFGAEPPARPAELKELDRFLGTWKTVEFVSKKAEWTPVEIRGSGSQATFQWIVDGWFLEERAMPANGRDHLGIWSYDPVEKAFRCAFFQVPGGTRMDFTHRWDEQAKVFNGTCPMADGVTMRSTIEFPDRNSKQWHAVATDKAGKVYLDMAAKEVRAEQAEIVKQAPEGAYVDPAAVALQGFWRAQSFVHDGKPAADQELKRVYLNFEANKVRMKIDSPDEVACTFKTDPKQSPLQIDIFFPDQKKTFPAIYELTDDVLRICISVAEPGKRPTEYSAKAKSGQMLIVLKRQKR